MINRYALDPLDDRLLTHQMSDLEHEELLDAIREREQEHAGIEPVPAEVRRHYTPSPEETPNA